MKRTKSIMSSNKECYLCGQKGCLQEHHCINGTANRKKSEEYGLKVWLCPDCHRMVHSNIPLLVELKKDAQTFFIAAYPELDFLTIFGRNYL